MPSKESHCRAIWAALELGRAESLDDLEVITGVRPEQSLQYLTLLIRHEYVRPVGVRRARSGEAVPVFRLVRRTGPDAPYLDIRKTLVDPNERRAAEMARKTENAPRKASLAARVRVAAEHLQSFTRPDLMAAVFGPEPSHSEQHWFRYAWTHLRLGGHICSAEDDWFYLARDVDPIVDSIRKILRESVGRMISRQSMSEALGSSPTGPQMRQAVDLLTAEGLQVIRRGYGRKTVFFIETIDSTNDSLPSD